MRFRRAHGGIPAGEFDPAIGDQKPEAMQPVHTIAGWLLAERGYSRVEVSVDGGPPERARLFALPHPELATECPDPSAALAGWTATLDLGDVEPGTRPKVTATAVGDSGRKKLGSARIRVTERPPNPPADPEWVQTLAARARADAARHAPGTGQRLLVFTHSVNLDGGSLYVVELVRQWLRDPATSCAVVVPFDGPMREELERCGASVHLFPAPGHGEEYESGIRELVLLAREVETTAIFASSLLSFTGIDLADRLGVPSVWAVHESMTLDRLIHGEWLWFDDYLAERLRACLDTADRIVFEAEATWRLFSDATTRDPSRLRHIDYGIDLAQADASRRRLDRDQVRAERGIARGERLLLCPATISPRKGQGLLALAFARVAADFPDVVLTLVGVAHAKEYVTGLREMVERLGLAPGRIRLEGSSTRIDEWFAAADAVVLPSDEESMPRVLLEAMAYELPILATSVWGVPELIEDGTNGLLCEPRDLDALEDGLRRVLSLSPDEATALGRAGGATVRPERDTALYAKKIRALLEQPDGAGTAG